MRKSWMMIAVLGFSLSALISCSSDDVASDLKDVEDKPEPGVPNAVGANDNSANSRETQEIGGGPSEHWILSVPFRKIEIGSFVMGSLLNENLRDDDEDPQQVKITKPFEIMIKEVTQSQWVQVMEENPSGFKSAEDCGDDHDSENDMCPNHPVERVSWNDVQKYIKKLNDSLDLTGCDGTPRSSKGCYRLPTEAEWEYSARAGTITAYSFGDDHSELEDYAWYGDNSDNKTHKVGVKKPNPWGLYDVMGNVWEFVQDKYANVLLGGTDPLLLSFNLVNMQDRNPGKSIEMLGSHRVLRGGSWYNEAKVMRSANRSRIRVEPLTTEEKSANIGFRLVRTL